MQTLTRYLALVGIALVTGAIAKAKIVERVVSPAGWCVASLHESPEGHNTSVILDFDNGRCGAGAVHFSGTGHPIHLRWLDAETLEVAHPEEVRAQRNASGEVIQCFKRKVRVVLVANSPRKKEPISQHSQLWAADAALRG